MKNKFTVFALFIFLFTGMNFAQTYYVSTTGNDANDGSPGTPWLTIQHAIDNVASGSTINVAAGTYTEDLTIPVGKTGIEFIGAGAGSTFIQGVTNVPIASWPLADPNIEILGNGTIIHGFTIVSPLWVDGFYSSGIVIGATDVEIYDNEFRIAGSDDTDDISQGIQTVFNADISGLNIHNNVFTHNAVSAAGYEGIYINKNSGVGTITVKWNSFTGNVLRAITTEASNSSIIENSIVTDLSAGLPGGYQGINITYAIGSGTVDNVIVDGNTVTGTGGGGFQFGVNIGTGANNNTFTNILIQGNDISGNQTGIRVREDAGDVIVTDNDLDLNTTYGINNADPGLNLLSAEANWWGNLSGPFNATTNALGTGSPVSDNVDYSPWYGADRTTTPMTYYGDTSDPDYVDDAIDNAQNGDEVIIQAGTYNAFTVDKEVTLTAEPGTIVNHGSPAITVAADNVTIDGFTFSYLDPDYAIQIDPNYTGTVIVNCNFDVPNAVDNQSNQTVLAENNYWGFNGAYDGPTISTNPGGTGGVISENPGAGAVDYDPWVGKTTSPVTGYVGTSNLNILVSWDWLNFFGPDFDFELDHGGVQGEDLSTSVNTNSINIAGPLLFNTTYNWYVRSQTDPLGTWIGPFSFTTTADDITLISPADLSEGVATSFTFTWSAAPGADDYQIQVDDDPAFGSPFIQTTTGGATSYAAVGLTPGTTYHWRVRATNNGGVTWGPWTASWEFFTTFLVSVSNPSQTNYAVGISVLPTFTWLAVAGAASYDLEVSTDPAFGALVPLTSSTSIGALTYTVANFEQLTSGTLYYWRVKANGGPSDGKYSGSWEFTTHLGNLTITTYYASGTSVNLAWLLLPYTANVKYDIYYSDDSFLSYTTIPNLTNAFYTINGLAAGTTYDVIVRAKNNAGTVIITYSSAVSFTTPGLPTPYQSYPIGGATTYSNPPYLYWYTGTLFSGQYQVRYATDPSVDGFGTLNHGSATFLAYTSNLYTVFPAPLTAGQTYYWQVRVFDGVNYGSWSSVESFVVYSSTPTVAPVPYPSWPVGGYYYYINPPTFFWYTGTFTTGLYFQVQWDDDSDLNVAPLGTSAWFASNLYYTLGASLTSGTYWWRVRSSVDNGLTWSAWSTTESFVIPASINSVSVAYPTSPVGVEVSTLNPTLSWFAVTPPALQYKVRISPYSSTDGNGMLNHVTATETGWIGVTSSAFNSLTFTPSITLYAGATYYWQVQSRLAAAPNTEASWSYVASFQTAAGAMAIVPFAVSPIQGQPINSTTALLSWALPSQPSTHLKYDVEYSKNADFSGAIRISSVDEKFAKVDGLDPNTKYYWRVYSKNNTGSQSVYSAVGSFNTGGLTSVEPEHQVIPANFILEQNYPNPFNPSTRINYAIPNDNFVTVKVYDMLGREVNTLVNEYRNAGSYSAVWNGEDSSGQKVASGTYVYRITAGSFVATKKMVLLK
ncbi:MAG TPA: fibronectin type III domain-containing protein [Melioribacteraceae bacterium]|nr:fibronectin type III domain-containing protein [Melioribacteraceae bacterium]